MADSKALPDAEFVKNATVEFSQDALISQLGSGKRNKYARFLLAALSSIPWVGGLFGASASLSAESEQGKVNELHRMWLEEHKEKAQKLGETLGEIISRLETFGEDVQERIESPEYLALVKRAFKSWDDADTEEKKEMLKRLIANAGATKICSDDVVRLFIHWIDLYHEIHFRVMRAVYKNPFSSRAEIWDSMSDSRPRDDSPEADLFRVLIRDLNTGGVIRQPRETDYQGRFLKRARSRTGASSSSVLESAFEETKPYMLTEIGKQFLHYVMEDVSPRLGSSF
jgi:hypothetical protein